MMRMVIIAALVAACGKGSSGSKDETGSGGSAGSAGSGGSAGSDIAAAADAAPAPTPADPARCTAAIGHAFDADRKGLKTLLSRDDAGLADMQAVMADHCAKDNWDVAVVECFEAVKDKTGVVACTSRLPDGLNKTLNDDIEAHKKKAPPKPDYGFTVQADHDPAIARTEVASGFGKMATAAYSYQSGANGAFAVIAHDLPAKWQKSKPKAVFAQFKTDLTKQKFKFGKESDVKVGKDAGHDVHYTGAKEDPKLGHSIGRERWFVHGNKLWQVRASWTSKAPHAADIAKAGDKFVESFTFTAPATPP